MKKYKTVYIDGNLRNQASCTFCQEDVPEVVEIEEKSFICKKCTENVLKEFGPLYDYNLNPDPKRTTEEIAKDCDWCGGDRLATSSLAGHELDRMMPDPCPECGWLFGWDE